MQEYNSMQSAQINNIVINVVKYFIAELQGASLTNALSLNSEGCMLTLKEEGIVGIILQELNAGVLKQRLNLTEASLLFYLKGVVEKLEQTN